MPECAIRAVGLSKRYRIGAAHHPYTTLRDAIPRILSAPARRLSRLFRTAPAANDGPRAIWALQDVSFDVAHGEAIGIIGRNGAGKSTLLKILSRITKPTSGWAETRGRVGSLLEVGTGFHPELSGRDNIYLNGAILGMRKAEIGRRFDEIVAFAEIEKFLDTPVKHYSSGMYVRLAFAVAAHLEPEILIIDEVLAVGDAAFQKKCLRKMGEVGRQGRTVIFVSHNLQAVSTLCTKALWIDGGAVRTFAGVRESVGEYVLSTVGAPAGYAHANPGQGAVVSVARVRVVDAEGQLRTVVECSQPFCIEIEIAKKSVARKLRVALTLRSASTGQVVLTTTDWDLGHALLGSAAGRYVVRCELPGNLLNVGSYLVSAGVDEPARPVLAMLENTCSFAIVSTRQVGEGSWGTHESVISPFQNWVLVSESPSNGGDPNGQPGP